MGNKAVAYSDIRENKYYRDRELITRFGLKSFLAVPVTVRKDIGTRPQPIGVICVYPNLVKNIEEISAELEEVAPFIALLYNASFDQLKIRLREQLVKRAGYSHEMGGFLHRVAAAFKDLIHVEGVSIFLYDERSKFLRLRGTTGTTHGIVKNVYYRHDSIDPTYKCLKENKPLILDKRRFDFSPTLPLEKTHNPLHSCILYPIQEASVPYYELDHKVFGVLRAFNHVLTHGGVRRLTTFGWEELKLIRFFVELTAVMAHFMKKGDNAKDDFDRRMHGAKNNLQATQFTLEQLEMASIQLPAHMEPHSIPNAITFLEDILAQIQRLELRQELVTEEVSLYGDVLAKIPPMIHRLSQVYKIGSFEVTNLKAAGFDRLPKVKGNTHALFCVFRNLAENAVKYCDPNKRRHEFKISYINMGDKVAIFISNDGVKIDEKDADLIFVEGFRTETAIARHPSSNGLGLSDSRDLMLRMRGSISYLKEEATTTFRIEIPIYI